MIQSLQAAAGVSFAILVIWAALRDLTSYTIPNWISLALLAAFPVAALSTGLSLPTVGVHLGVGLVALLLGMGMFAAGWVGGGDAKLLAAAALWMGWPSAIAFVGLTGLAGGAFTFILLGLRNPLIRPAVLSGPRWFTRLAEPGESIPYGVAIAIGALAAFPNSMIGSAVRLAG
jgi:prepilin peptidase CpaA